MITVSILINNTPIITRSAVRKHTSKDSKFGEYYVDDGRILTHIIDDGAVKLAIEMLKGVHKL